MLRFRSTLAVLLATTVVASAAALSNREPPPPVRVGTYDSRALAIAFANSTQLRGTLEGLAKQRNDATDAEAKAACEKKGAAIQERLHRQGFSTASVADILAVIEKDLPAIATESGVDVLVSKWDLAYRREGVEFVDVTARIVAPFHPDERVQKMIASLEGVKPLGLYETDWETVDRH